MTNPPTRMDIRTQVSSKYRQDGAKYSVAGVTQVVQACSAAFAPDPTPPQNNHGINTVCFQVTDFSNMVAFTWAHESQHLAVAQQEAQMAENDIYAAWEGVIETSSDAAFIRANGIQNDAHARIASASNSIHTGASSNFVFWYGFGNWQLSTITVIH